MQSYLFFLAIAIIFIFFLYLIFDFASTNANAFGNKWTKKTLWIWLPFYALWRLIREVFFLDKN